MTNPKMQPCPKCGSAEYLAVYTYYNGWRHVECVAPSCSYLGPGEGSIRAAIKSHNKASLDKAEHNAEPEPRR
jgi:Zn ribbon nucleic-acid-binding protein